MGIPFISTAIILSPYDEFALDAHFIIVWTSEIGWLLIVGVRLYKLSSKSSRGSYKLFMTVGLLLLVGDVIFNLMFTQQEIAEFGWEIIVLYFVFNIVAVSIVFSYPARLLVSFESKEEIDINDYFGDIFRFIFWPIGIWNIQPRLNRLLEKTANPE